MNDSDKKAQIRDHNIKFILKLIASLLAVCIWIILITPRRNDPLEFSWSLGISAVVLGAVGYFLSYPNRLES